MSISESWRENECHCMKQCEWCGAKIIHEANKRFCSDKCRTLASRKDLKQTIREHTVVDPNTGCWNWQGRHDKAGYGMVSRFRINALVHAVMWELKNGRVSPGFELHHICDNKGCCNPAHLEPVTRLEHKQKHRPTHCRRGHVFTNENTYVWKRHHICKTCRRLRQRKKGGYAEKWQKSS
jgi:predicted nucleic acid-binding Zn ribbon protein